MFPCKSHVNFYGSSLSKGRFPFHGFNGFGGDDIRLACFTFNFDQSNQGLGILERFDYCFLRGRHGGGKSALPHVSRLLDADRSI